jgi:hypothetical protein
VLSPIGGDEQASRTLLRAGPEGRQAWNDFKAKGIEQIKRRIVFAKRERRSRKSFALARSVAKAHSPGDGSKAENLKALYGKKQAQTLRDLAELSTVIYTAPAWVPSTPAIRQAALRVERYRH